MKLEAWRKEQGWSYDRLAKKVGAAQASVVRRWCLGQVMPSPEFQLYVQEATGGAVGPSDWPRQGKPAGKRKGR